MSTRRPNPGIDVTAGSWTNLISIADSSKVTETGGILFGFRQANRIRVVGVEEVPDPHATATTYTLHTELAQELLDEARSHFPPNSPVGYIGDWHTHLANSPPSFTDRRTVARLGRYYPRRMASIVVARRDDEWIPHGILVTRLRSRPCGVHIVCDGECP